MNETPPKRPQQDGRKRLKVLLAALAFVAGGLLGVAAIGAIWEGWASDRLLQVRAMLGYAGKDPGPRVAVIGLDQAALSSKSLETVPRVFMTPAFAEAGTALLEAGALGIGFDFVFAFSADAFEDPQTGDKRLTGFDRPFQMFLYRNRGKVFVAKTSTGVPHRTISAAAGTEGVRMAEIIPGSDGVVRRHTPALPLARSPSMIDALMALGGASDLAPYETLPQKRLASVVPYMSLIDALALARSDDGRLKLAEFARDRIVLFGSTLPNEDEHLYSDRFLPLANPATVETGISGRPPYRTPTSGVYVLADLIDAPLTGRYAVPSPEPLVYALILGFALAGAFAGLNLPLWSLPIGAVGLVSAGLAPALIGLETGWIIPPGAAPVAGFAALVFAGIGKVGVLQRRERELVRLFGHYLAPDVIKRMAEQERLSDLGGETRAVVVAFIDIVGFTKMSERLRDREVVEVVNMCFGMIGREITRSEGYIDKYIGDAIMAMWNAPNDVADPEQQALVCSRKILQLLPEIRRKTGQPQLDLRIALNGGPGLVGDIGGRHRRSFTVMGTTVNTASRIEAIAKDSKVRLAFSGSVAERLDPETRIEEIWRGQLRGLTTETVVYTLEDPLVSMADREHRAPPLHLAATGKE